MHGEYKMPGGKLIVADLDVEADRLVRVQISGDFFLEPDSALDSINRALERRDATSSEDELTAHIETATAGQVRMYGISARAVAIAVGRALESNA